MSTKVYFDWQRQTVGCTVGGEQVMAELNVSIRVEVRYPWTYKALLLLGKVYVMLVQAWPPVWFRRWAALKVQTRINDGPWTRLDRWSMAMHTKHMVEPRASAEGSLLTAYRRIRLAQLNVTNRLRRRVPCPQRPAGGQREEGSTVGRSGPS